MRATSGHDSLLPDLEKLLAAADGILERIDALVAFSGDAAIDSGQPVIRRRVAAWSMPLRGAQPAASQHAIAGQILVVDDNASNRDLLARQLDPRWPCG